MRYLLPAIALLSFLGLGLIAEDKAKAPAKLTFAAKNGDVAYDHAAHAKREKNNCKVCHDALWPQSAKAPLNWKAGMHKPAEAKKISCGKCHTPGGAAFESKGNCTGKCHKPAAKKG
jgi:c(7)-type cytochrome triheme protein